MLFHYIVMKILFIVLQVGVGLLRDAVDGLVHSNSTSNYSCPRRSSSWAPGYDVINKLKVGHFTLPSKYHACSVPLVKIEKILNM